MEEDKKKPVSWSIDTKNPREAAFLSLLISIRKESFISSALDEWRKKQNPIPADFNLAFEIANGSCRMRLALNWLAEKLANRKQLHLRLREEVLIQTALYQHFFMDRIPLYAIVNESVNIAKKYSTKSFASFLNAILRKLEETSLELPKGNTVPDISIRYSCPKFFVKELIQNYGLEKAESILEIGNSSPKVMFRIRPEAKDKQADYSGVKHIAGILTPMVIIEDMALLPQIAQSPDYYIQNATPALLMHTLARNALFPKRVLDLCASPGGKSIAIFDLFSNIELFANDISSNKLKTLQENLDKYGIQATLSCSKGQNFATDQLFDLVILDVPCSNSGVLNKRPEARWRISQEKIEQLEQLQLGLIKQAKKLIKEDGEIWYMTCSILKRENTRLIDKASENFSLSVRVKETMFPNIDGFDGGFACALNNA